ncbi:TetR/AcrR family transcriptional regulator [Nonomuraea antimicrobica]
MLKRGIKGLTVAEIAERAHVAKGTVYLHWSTREDLLVGMFARDFLAMLDAFTEAIAADPDAARPSRLLPLLVRHTVEHPFVRALQIEDADLLGALTRHPRTTRLREDLGPAALMYIALPVWREHHLARTDWTLDDQAYALDALLSGLLIAATGERVLPVVSVADPARVSAAAVTALLGPETPGHGDVQATAEAALTAIAAKRDVLLDSIGKRED